MKNLSYRQWGMLFTFISAAVIGAVFFSQYVLKMPPCHLCLMERMPYYTAFALGILLIALADRRSTARFIVGLLGVTFLYSTALSAFHFGVEEKWWIYASDCAGQSTYKAGASVEEMMAALRNAPTVRCDQAIPFIFGMSMAFYNILTSAGLFLLTCYVWLSRNAVRG